MAYVIDADWAINALAQKRQASTTLRRLAPEGLAISWTTVGEIYEGAFQYPDPQAHLETLRQFLHPLRILGLNDPIMERFAGIRASLRRSGQLIPDFDILLAATALHHGLTVLTFNLRHFSRIPDLKVYKAS
ncbi:MAG: type II toxin-antitoxin system VapC family toxin [Dehalococcoidia bacterium]|nr:type II toxin-antitoxin system VapC family toxin [Dehalococcoidia bacterium]